MTDHIDRAAEVLRASVDNRGIGGRLFLGDCNYLARVLADAGLLVTPERDAAVAALPLPVDGCACTPHEQSAGGGYTEYLLEYEPACPEHSEHLWDPKQGMWVLRSERDAAVAARALREAADDVYASSGEGQWPKSSVIAYLRDRAARFEREAGESNADT